ncbi:MAG: 16S rRNA (cytosine(1402)-N(4))-methyltransferase RsmH [Prevotellaceae bacterium]|jgi:16S rRNA (cytosine1402-N4)-methyltransferase|nr:16S rRNA (cytosine(1402)-N(4))-methyltransferase RsmH [Prevotellaceae bacterium]
MYHVPVLLNETVDGLNIQPNGTYVDITFGGGGHAREVLKRLAKKGRLIAFDQDPDAVQNAAAIGDKRLTLVQGSFRFLRSYLRYHNAAQVDGILGDLGVSWHQFDTADRGFSFRFDANLDMRMNNRGGLTAANILNTYSIEQLTKIFRLYGELDNAYKLAQMVEKVRTNTPLENIAQLTESIRAALPKFDEHKYLAKVFQALRIEVNQEMVALEQMLLQTEKVVKTGGRLSVITYHSLEDRMVKNYIKCGNVEGAVKKDLFGKFSAPFEAVTKKIILPQEIEIQNNTRARSAKLRVAERI